MGIEEVDQEYIFEFFCVKGTNHWYGGKKHLIIPTQ